MAAVLDEETGLIYLFGDPDASARIDEWSTTGAAVFDDVVPTDEYPETLDLSFADLSDWVAA